MPGQNLGAEVRRQPLISILKKLAMQISSLPQSRKSSAASRPSLQVSSGRQAVLVSMNCYCRDH